PALRRKRQLSVAALETRQRFARPDVDSLLAVILYEELRQVGWKDAGADPRFGNHHRHVAAHQPQRRGDFRADEPAAEHGEAALLSREPTELSIVVVGAIVDDLVRLEREAARGAARREQQLVVGDDVAEGLGDGL